MQMHRICNNVVFAYCKRSNNGGGSGLGTMLHILLVNILQRVLNSFHNGILATPRLCVVHCPYMLGSLQQFLHIHVDGLARMQMCVCVCVCVCVVQCPYMTPVVVKHTPVYPVLPVAI